MKARVKATGEIVEVNQCAIIYDDGTREIMRGTELDEVQGTPDYWTRLEHQYVGMAMQGFLAGRVEDTYKRVAEFSINQAHALVEKLKEKEERK